MKKLTLAAACLLLASCENVAITPQDALALIKIQAHINGVQTEATKAAAKITETQSVSIKRVQDAAEAAVAKLPSGSNAKAAQIQKDADKEELKIKENSGREFAELQKAMNDKAKPFFEQGKYISDSVCKANKLPPSCVIDLDKMTVSNQVPPPAPAPAPK